MTEVINGATHTWAIAYDARGRLSSVTRDGTATSYAYDPNGNLTQINGATFGTYDAQDRLIDFTPPGGPPWTLSYTNNGDLQSKADSAQEYDFDYDLSSNLRGVQITGTGAASVNYVIDGLNRRVEKEATSAAPTVNEGLLYDEQGRVVAELDGSNNVLSTFVYGLKPNVPDYMVRGGVAYRIVSDWRGDVRLVLDTTKTGAGAVVEQIDYDDWGNVVNLVDPNCTQGGTTLCWQPFGFAGGVWDVTTGIVRFGARDYDPGMRRWTQKDPLTFGGGQENIYEYVGDEPVNGSDPSGTGGLFYCETQCRLGDFVCLFECLLSPEPAGGFCPADDNQSQECTVQNESGVCTKNAFGITKRCGYKCDDGSQCTTYVRCQGIKDDPACPASCTK